MPPTVHPDIFFACNDDEGVNPATYVALGRDIDLMGLLDILEMKAVRDSWNHAEMLNSDERAAHDKAIRDAQGHR